MTWFPLLMSSAGTTEPPAPSSTLRTSHSTNTLDRISRVGLHTLPRLTLLFTVRLTHFLPSGKYQVAMVPYLKDENGTMIAMAPPSCSCRLERINLGQHALLIIFSKSITMLC